MSLAQQGFAVVNFSYHLALESKFPVSVDSAGATLLYNYTMFCINPVYAGKFACKPLKRFISKAILLTCGEYQVNANSGDEEHPLQHVFHCNIKTEEAKQCNKEECDFLKRYL